ncbi:hypothetical protein V6C53_08140 [Desulfocurvibacter africanus]|uniref:hypothetical protein n=1 Tax=Desulfocurvibacter africanus TaxID=873 RepID=UPI002FDB3DE6
MTQHHFLFLSPSGSTRVAAWAAAEELGSLGAQCRITDLSPVLRREAPLPNPLPGECLWVGTPVFKTPPKLILAKASEYPKSVYGLRKRRSDMANALA